MTGQVLIYVKNKIGKNRINAWNIDQNIVFEGRIASE
jgi:hypothetical protein